MKRSEDSSGRCGPDLYNVQEAAKFLSCSERQVRQEIHEGKITYRRPPGGIRFMTEDLLERLRPIGGPSASKASKRGKKPSAPEAEAKLIDQPGVELSAALQVLEDILRDQGLQSTKVAALANSCWKGELCANLANLDVKVATAIITVIAARALGGSDAQSLLQTFFSRTEGLP